MSASFLLIFSTILLICAYWLYGKFLVGKFDINVRKPTPAHTQRDNIDYMPTKPFILLGHHFASIAGAGPIVGPVLAATFGWGPVWLWIIIGVIFIGGVHDFSAMIASVRHRGKSIGELIEKYIGRTGKLSFLIFTWFMLILVIAVFTKIIAETFAFPETASTGTSSVLFIAIAIAFGFSIYKLKFSFLWSSIIGFLLLLGCVYAGLEFPVHLDKNIWTVLIFAYIFVAAVVPVWILLQPRDYLNSFLLYLIMVGGFLGILFTNPSIEYPFFTTYKTNLGYLFPILFVTVACGAVSGFHSLVASGTTSKQLNSETDVRPIGYGGMLIEAILAVIALITVAVMSRSDYQSLLSGNKDGAILIFSQGIGQFMTSLGIREDIGRNFAALAISAFALTTLDTTTRLGRFIFQEFFESVSAPKILYQNRYLATLITLVCAGFLTYTGTMDILWPLFGSANQMLAAMALLGVSAWLSHQKKKNTFVVIPMVFMFLVTLLALGTLIVKHWQAKNYLLFGVALCMFMVGMSLVVKSIQKK